ncbi:hypothetical protein D4R99_02190 [bacterium]|nr:MAG: hypothetical protein D4R99_02190 [bacterium]
MKKEIKKRTPSVKNTGIKKESDSEMLARLMANGFEKINEKFEKINEKFEKITTEMCNRFDDVDIRLTNLTLEQKETNLRLNAIERHEMGMLESIDASVHRNEFTRLVKRVEVLEK